MRESPAIPIVRRLLAEGAKVSAYDPAAQDEARASSRTVPSAACLVDLRLCRRRTRRHPARDEFARFSATASTREIVAQPDGTVREDARASSCAAGS